MRCPYHVDNSTLFVAWYASAELHTHLSLGWPRPANILDLYPEFRALRNGFGEKRGLVDAVRYFGGDPTSYEAKDAFRKLAMQDRRSNRFSASEREGLLQYCWDDVEMTRYVLKFMEPYVCQHLRLSLDIRGEYMRSCTLMERTGVPLDVPTLRRLQKNWNPIRRRLAGSALREFPFYEGLHFNHEKFGKFILACGLGDVWPTTDGGQFSNDKNVWKDQLGLHPELRRAYDLISTMKINKLNVACGSDGCNRVMLSAFGASTGRNTPSEEDSKKGSFIFAPARFTRFLIKPPKGWSVAYLDYVSQEFGICAALSGDRNMSKCYTDGDPYLEFAKLAGAVPPDATRKSHGDVRKPYKAVTLGVGYGMQWRKLARNIGVPGLIARRLLAQYRAIFSVFCEWREAMLDRFIETGTVETVMGWPLHRDGQHWKTNTVLNFPAQANAADMLRLAIIEGHKRGVEICAPIHDAVLIQAPTKKINDAVKRMTEAMVVASRIILSGFELRVESKVIHYPHRFTDDGGVELWRKVTKI
jgi:hypothetical protein